MIALAILLDRESFGHLGHFLGLSLSVTSMTPTLMSSYHVWSRFVCPSSCKIRSLRCLADRTRNMVLRGRSGRYGSEGVGSDW
jgi:hypothetical protein